MSGRVVSQQQAPAVRTSELTMAVAHLVAGRSDMAMSVSAASVLDASPVLESSKKPVGIMTTTNVLDASPVVAPSKKPVGTVLDVPAPLVGPAADELINDILAFAAKPEQEKAVTRFVNQMIRAISIGQRAVDTSIGLTVKAYAEVAQAVQTGLTQLSEKEVLSSDANEALNKELLKCIGYRLEDIFEDPKELQAVATILGLTGKIGRGRATKRSSTRSGSSVPLSRSAYTLFLDALKASTEQEESAAEENTSSSRPRRNAGNQQKLARTVLTAPNTREVKNETKAAVVETAEQIVANIVELQQVAAEDKLERLREGYNAESSVLATFFGPVAGDDPKAQRSVALPYGTASLTVNEARRCWVSVLAKVFQNNKTDASRMRALEQGVVDYVKLQELGNYRVAVLRAAAEAAVDALSEDLFKEFTKEQPEFTAVKGQRLYKLKAAVSEEAYVRVLKDLAGKASRRRDMDETLQAQLQDLADAVTYPVGVAELTEKTAHLKTVQAVADRLTVAANLPQLNANFLEKALLIENASERADAVLKLIATETGSYEVENVTTARMSERTGEQGEETVDQGSAPDDASDISGTSVTTDIKIKNSSIPVLPQNLATHEAALALAEDRAALVRADRVEKGIDGVDVSKVGSGEVYNGSQTAAETKKLDALRLRLLTLSNVSPVDLSLSKPEAKELLAHAIYSILPELQQRRCNMTIPDELQAVVGFKGLAEGHAIARVPVQTRTN